MKKFDRAHTIQTRLQPRSGSAIRMFSTNLTHNRYHTNDRMRCNTGKTELAVRNGGRLNPGIIP
jgi:hypothetical protein